MHWNKKDGLREQVLQQNDVLQVIHANHQLNCLQSLAHMLTVAMWILGAGRREQANAAHVACQKRLYSRSAFACIAQHA